MMRSITAMIERQASHVRRGAGCAWSCALLVAAGCLPPVVDEALTPVAHRSTNESHAVDLQIFDRWSERLVVQMAATDADAVQERERIRALAAADAWLVFARDEYLREPRSPVTDDAFRQATMMIEALERHTISAGDPPHITGTTRVRPELWSQLAEAEGRSDSDPAALGEAGVMLVRAGRIQLPGDTAACDPAPFLARAEAMIAALAAPRAAPPPSLAAAATPAPAAPPVVVRAVHFAFDSDAIGPAGMEMLDRVIAALATFRDVRIELQGFADPRGSSAYNLELSRRRAIAVQQYIASRTTAVTAFTIKPVGRARSGGPLGDRVQLARDRRVDLRIVLPDGTEAGRAEGLESDLQVERAPAPAARRGGAS